MAFDKKRPLLLNPDIVYKDISDAERILFNPENGYIQVVNETGKFILDKCDGSLTAGQLAEIVRNNYQGIPAKGLEAEINAFLEKAIAMRWVREAKH